MSKVETVTRRPQARSFVLRSAVAASIAALLPASAALAGPKDARVAKGTARVETRGSDTVIRAGDRAVINYSSFDVARGERVTFVQPSAAARVLNRIDGGAPSRIDGAIRANGRVYFVNPSGVVFGAGSSVQAAGFVAAAANLSDGDFLAGVDRFTGGGGLVSNAGSIRADGTVALVGGRVENAGEIEGGVVALVAGGETYLSTPRGGRLMVNVTGGAGGGGGGGGGDAAAAGVSNTGTARARTQFVAAAGDLYSLAVRTSGTIRAPDVSVTAAPSRLGGAAAAGVVDVAGAVDASSADGAGGRVAITGDYVKLDHATLDASGATGGGGVEVGGGWQGTGGLAHARAVYVGADATIRADATARGDGGTVAVWSDGATAFAGAITARGGPRGGDGGRVETSGASLTAIGRVDTTAPRGATGSYLLDPGNIVIGPAPTGTALSVLDGNGRFLAPDTSGTTSYLSADAIAERLKTSDVVVSTEINYFNPTAAQLADAAAMQTYVSGLKPNEGSITLNSPILYTGSKELRPNAKLTLKANAGIKITQDIKATGTGPLSLELRAWEGFRKARSELSKFSPGVDLDFSLAQGAMFVDDRTGGIHQAFRQGVEIGRGGAPLEIKTNGGDVVASGRFIQATFGNSDAADANFPQRFSSTFFETNGGKIDFRASGAIDVITLRTRVGDSDVGGSITLYAGQSFRRGERAVGAILAPSDDRAAFVYQRSGQGGSGQDRLASEIDAGNGEVRIRGGAVVLAGDSLTGGDVSIVALGFNERQPVADGVTVIDDANPDILISDYISDITFFRNNADGVTKDSPIGEIRQAIKNYRATDDASYARYDINGESVTVQGRVRVYPEYELGINASAGDVRLQSYTQPVPAGGTRTTPGVVDGRGYLTLAAPQGTVRVDEAIGSLSGRPDANKTPSNSVPLLKVNVTGRQVEVGTVIASGPVRLHATGKPGVGPADGDIRVVGTNPVWLTSSGGFDVNVTPAFALNEGSVAPVYVSDDFTLDPNQNLYQFDIRKSDTTIPGTFKPFALPGFAFNAEETAKFVLPYAVDTEQKTFSSTARTAAEEIAGATPQQARGLDVSRGVSADVARTLSQIGIVTRDVRTDEVLTALIGSAYYDDVVAAANVGGNSPAPQRTYVIDAESMRANFEVAKPRVAADAADAVVRQFDSVARRDPQTGAPLATPRNEAIKSGLERVTAAYLEQNPGEIDAAKLRAFIEASGDRTVINDVRGWEELLTRIDRLGLAPAERAKARTESIRFVLPDGIEALDVGTLERVIDRRTPLARAR